MANVELRTMGDEDWGEVASLIYDSTNAWYVARGRPAIFAGPKDGPTLFCAVYEQLDPGCCVVADDRDCQSPGGILFLPPAFDARVAGNHERTPGLLRPRGRKPAVAIRDRCGGPSRETDAAGFQRAQSGFLLAVQPRRLRAKGDLSRHDHAGAGRRARSARTGLAARAAGDPTRPGGDGRVGVEREPHPARERSAVLRRKPGRDLARFGPGRENRAAWTVSSSRWPIPPATCWAPASCARKRTRQL